MSTRCPSYRHCICCHLKYFGILNFFDLWPLNGRSDEEVTVVTFACLSILNRLTLSFKWKSHFGHHLKVKGQMRVKLIWYKWEYQVILQTKFGQNWLKYVSARANQSVDRRKKKETVAIQYLDRCNRLGNNFTLVGVLSSTKIVQMYYIIVLCNIKGVH